MFWKDAQSFLTGSLKVEIMINSERYACPEFGDMGEKLKNLVWMQGWSSKVALPLRD